MRIVYIAPSDLACSVKAPVKVDLESLWAQLGVRQIDGEVTFDEKALLAALSTAMTKPSQP
jgi:hypothetical protein